MRTLLVFLAGVALIPPALAASTRPQASSLSLTTSSYRVLYGHGMTLSGRLSGPHAAGRAVSITAWPYGRSAPVKVAVVRTAKSGRWTYQAAPTVRTTYWASAGPATSRKIVVGVAPALTMKVLSSGHVSVHVTGSRTFFGRSVEIQLRNADGSWTTVMHRVVGPNGTATVTRSLPEGTIRAALSVNQAGAGYLGAVTHALKYRPLGLFIHPASFRVLYGHAVTLTGRLVNGHAGRHVAIIARPYGHRATRVATVTTGTDGRFSVSVRPRIMTTYQARLGSVRPSAARTVGVQPAISIAQLANGRVHTHVTAARSFRGRMVQLQRLVGSSWRTVAKQALRAGSSTTFAVSLPRTVVRVAMSVNQAGAGYLGSSSHPLVIRAV